MTPARSATLHGDVAYNAWNASCDDFDMKLPVPFIQLPLVFDAAALAAEVEALGELVWRDHPQKFPGNSMLPLLAAGGDPANESFVGEMAPTPELQRCPYLLQTIASLGAVAGRTRLMRLAGQAEVTPHVDQGYYWTDRVRVHVPIVTQPTVRFECGRETIHMAEGECWIFDTWREHRVVNDASRSRIHLVVDTVGGARFWELVAQGRRHDAPRDDWMTKRVLPNTEHAPLDCERYNIPAVMSPWEIIYRLQGLLDEADQASPLTRDARQLSETFFRTWRSLWVQYADSGNGIAEYREALYLFLQNIPPAVAQLPLRNGTLWMDGVLALIGKMAVLRTP